MLTGEKGYLVAKKGLSPNGWEIIVAGLAIRLSYWFIAITAGLERMESAAGVTTRISFPIISGDLSAAPIYHRSAHTLNSTFLFASYNWIEI